MKTLSEFSTEELKEEVDRRKKENTKPIPLINQGFLEDWDATRNLCRKYINDIAKDHYADDDLKYYIFEAAMEAVFGKNLWAWVNGITK